jgi:hypothetical protein
MMDCKKALAECAGDAAAAAEWLRKKGLSGADKKAGRLAAEGAVAAYIHPGSRLGVLLEVNCETDFVAAGEAFNQLTNGLAMQARGGPLPVWGVLGALFRGGGERGARLGVGGVAVAGSRLFRRGGAWQRSLRAP